VPKEGIRQNLQDTADAFSDSDDEDKPTKKNESAKKIDVKKIYASGRKMMLDIRAIIRDGQGTVLSNRPLQKFSELF